MNVLHIYVPHRHLHEQAMEMGWQGGAQSLEVVDPCFGHDAALSALCGCIADVLPQHEASDRLYFESVFSGITARMIRCWSNASNAKRVSIKGGLSPWQLKRACEAIEAGIAGEFGLEDLAAIVGLSPTHFSRAFKQSTGVPPFQWLLERRIERAQTLLNDGRMTLAEIALAVGFGAQPQFTTAFRRVTGVTPGAWRRERLL